MGFTKATFFRPAKVNDGMKTKSQRLADPEDTLTREEERIVARGFKQLKQGKYVTWDQLKRELGLMKSRTAGYRGR